MAEHYRWTCEGCGEHGQASSRHAARAGGDRHAPKHNFSKRYVVEHRKS